MIERGAKVRQHSLSMWGIGIFDGYRYAGPSVRYGYPTAIVFDFERRLGVTARDDLLVE
jgi:hypothetical protein